MSVPVISEDDSPEVETVDTSSKTATDKTAGTEPARSRVQVIDRAARLMSVISAAPEPVSLKQLCEKTGLHSATAHRILASLCVNGLVERVGDQRFYAIGKEMIRVVKDQDTRERIASVAGGRMRAISEGAQGTVRLLFRQNRELICQSQFINGVVEPYTGLRFAMHTNPVGKLWLGHLGQTYVRRYVESLELALLKQQNVTFPKLWTDIVNTVSRGFALERTDSNQAVVTLGVLIRNHMSSPVAALTLVSEQSRIESHSITQLREAATYISDQAFVSGEYLSDLIGS